MKEKLIRIFCIWQPADTPLKQPDTIGPFIIFLLTPILYTIKTPTNSSFYIHFLLYLIFQTIGLIFLTIVCKYKMINSTIHQIGNIFMYSQVWWIVFSPISMFTSSYGIHTLFLLVLPLLVLTAKRLGNLMIQDDVILFFALIQVIPGLLMFGWTFL